MYRGDGLNLYGYVENNPINYTDSSGYCKEKENIYENTPNLDESNLGNINGKTPATRVAYKFRKLPASKRPNTVAVIRTKDGKYVIGKNSGGVVND